ncbi:hypothetical protein PAMA_020220 [Pampus argenteus]
MEMEMQTATTNGNDACKQVTASNGGDQTHAAETERDGLLSKQSRAVCRIQDQLNEVIFWRVKLWMIIIFIFLLIFAVIMISLAVCSAIHEDVDEKFDAALFNVSQKFNGSFRLSNQVFTEELLNISSNERRTLAADLQKKLADLYRSSVALARYFSKAEIYAFRNGSVIADYQLTFLMPPDQQDQLRNFTLSREMVYNVFRQFLYDQEKNELYIDPVSLNMF